MLLPDLGSLAARLAGTTRFGWYGKSDLSGLAARLAGTTRFGWYGYQT